MTHNNNSMGRYSVYLTHRGGATTQLASPRASLQPCPVYLCQPAQVAARAQLLNVKPRHARPNRSERRAATGVATRSGFIAFYAVALSPLSAFDRSAQIPVVPGVSGVASTVKLV